MMPKPMVTIRDMTNRLDSNESLTRAERNAIAITLQNLAKCPRCSDITDEEITEIRQRRSGNESETSIDQSKANLSEQWHESHQLGVFEELNEE